MLCHCFKKDLFQNKIAKGFKNSTLVKENASFFLNVKFLKSRDHFLDNFLAPKLHSIWNITGIKSFLSFNIFIQKVTFLYKRNEFLTIRLSG